jgi:hypothetical protein
MKGKNENEKNMTIVWLRGDWFFFKLKKASLMITLVILIEPISNQRKKKTLFLSFLYFPLF